MNFIIADLGDKRIVSNFVWLKGFSFLLLSNIQRSPDNRVVLLGTRLSSLVDDRELRNSWNNDFVMKTFKRLKRS